MARSRFVRVLALVFASVAMLRSWVVAQEPDQLALAGRRPRFIAAGDPSGREVDVSKAVVLLRRVSLDLVGVPVDSALKAITRGAQLRISYSAALLPPGKRVTIRAQDLAVAAALTEVLIGTGLDVAVAENGRLAIVAAEGRVGVSQADSGAVVGRVTDRKTGAALVGATVVVDGTRRTATTTSDGRYRVAGLAAGTYTVRARYIGYAPGTASVAVTAGQEATADFALEKSVQRLDEVVTTGTVVPTEVKALPTPISVITSQDIEQQHIRRLEEAIRLAVPGAVVWEPGTGSLQGTQVSVRGASGFGAGNGPKVYIDGVEASIRSWSPIDPQSIERIEVVRGPQAAAIYGSDAMGGVVQVFTKRGSGTKQRPEIDLQAALGVVQSDFKGSGALRQEYNVALQGQRGVASYHIGGGYARTGDWLPNYNESLPSVNGALRVEDGRLTVDLSARYYRQNQETVDNPVLQDAWPAVFSSVPHYLPFRGGEETYAARLTYRATRWWQHEVTAGVDRFSYSLAQTRPRLVTPADTFLSVTSQDAPKLSFAYHTAVTAPLAPGFVVSVTAGADHWMQTSDINSVQALSSSGIVAVVSGTEFLERDRITNTGVFAQTQLNVRETFFVTGAVRGEWNSGFGADIGVPVSPRAGVAYVRPLGATTVKLRAAYGEAIRPPASGLKDSVATSFEIQQSNPLLKPERQVGPDFGLDLIGRGWSLGVTHYRQIAKDLITGSVVGIAGSAQVVRFQNLARVRNVGWEFEGAVQAGPVTATGHYSIVRSEAEDLGSYTGDLKVGDQMFGIPRHTAAVTLAATPFRRTSVTAALAYTGARRDYDYVAYYRCFGGTGPCPGFALGNYLVNYPGFATINLSIEREVIRGVTGYVGAQDLTNAAGAARAGLNFLAVQGRVTTVGVRVRS